MERSYCRNSEKSRESIASVRSQRSKDASSGRRVVLERRKFFPHSHEQSSLDRVKKHSPFLIALPRKQSAYITAQSKKVSPSSSGKQKPEVFIRIMEKNDTAPSCRSVKAGGCCDRTETRLIKCDLSSFDSVRPTELFRLPRDERETVVDEKSHSFAPINDNSS